MTISEGKFTCKMKTSFTLPKKRVIFAHLIRNAHVAELVDALA